MRVKRVSADDVKLHDMTKVKLKTAGNTQVVQFTAGNNKSCPVRNLSKDTYLDTKTGEVKPKKKSENRYESPKSVRKSIKTDGDGNLTTFYTRGAELLTLERTDELRYYLYNGHGNVRQLVDDNGAVTDTYDYDAFGNITEQTGDTENSYLYCGEQFDANTGFYYLRARYMNPGTGTFISMDSYQGSLFDPVSLHKYLYANANPVMYTDPTGYFSLSELNITQTIQGVINSVTTPNFLAIMNKLNTIATIYDTVVMIKNVLQDAEGSGLEVAWALGNGLILEFEKIIYNAKEGNR